jgi:hypothetical protein
VVEIISRISKLGGVVVEIPLSPAAELQTEKYLHPN